MGIKDLWSILNPYCKRKPLYELQGKVVAIDLAGWICESLCVVDYQVQARFYLRNLFFRTCYLLLSGVTPVFVLEGTAPALKHGVISKRNDIQFRGAAPRQPKTGNDAEKSTGGKGRTRFNYVLKQCEDLISSMGLQCVQGTGEAEAFCAQLNAAKLVDGVISQDSDCFAYGARRVYRNFSVSTQGNASAIGGAVDVYDMDIVEKTMDFGRNKMIVMALLCGCDYCPEGVGGVGKDAVQKLFAMCSEGEILDRLRSWRTQHSKYTALEIKVDDKSLCVNCGHYGRVQKHTKSGCGECKTMNGCDASLWKEQRLAIKAELQIRKKAMQIDNFPSQEIIDEFLQELSDLTELDLRWKQPNLVKFLRFMGSLMQWEEIYCLQKFLPLLTRWQLFHYGSGNQNIPLKGNIWPDFIKKKRAPKGIPSYEIVWKDDQSCFEGLIPKQQLDVFLNKENNKDVTETLQSLWSTIEPIDLVEKAYPQLVETFLQTKVKKTKETKRSQAKTKATVEKPRNGKKRSKKTVDSSLHDMSSLQLVIDELDSAGNKASDSNKQEMPRKKKKSKAADCPANNVQTIDHFFVRKTSKDSLRRYESPKIKTCTAPLSLSYFKGDEWEDSRFAENVDDLSGIINDLVSQAPILNEFCGKKLRFDEVEVNMEEIEIKEDEAKKNLKQKRKKHFENLQLVFDEDSDCDSPVNEEIETNAKESSFDEFDLIVMNKAVPKSIITKFTAEQKGGDKSNILCSTPILVNRFLSRQPETKAMNSPKVDIEETIADNGMQCDVHVSSFFIDRNCNDIDLFEQSVDFKNIEDEYMVSDEKDTSSEGLSSNPLEKSSGKDSDEKDDLKMLNGENTTYINTHDTLDRFLGLDND